MTIQTSDAVENARLDVIEQAIGPSPKLLIYPAGVKPLNCAAPAIGNVLAEILLPADYMSDATGRIKTKSGTWSGVGTAAAGNGVNAGYFRIVDSAGVACGLQGTVSGPGGGGDLTLDDISIKHNRVVSVNSFTLIGNNQ